MPRSHQNSARTLLAVFVLCATGSMLGAATMLGAAAMLGATAAAATVGATDAWVNPIAPGKPPDVVEHFSPPAEDWLAGHRGVDLVGAPGDSVYSAGTGVVSYAGWIANRPVVAIDHGALRTTYEPVTASVLVGEAVVTGQQLGTLALGGHCSGKCLHWGLKRGDQYLDPLSLLVRVPPVLKPIGGNAHPAHEAEVLQSNGRSANARSARTPVVRQSERNDGPSGAVVGVALAGAAGITASVVGSRLRR